MTLLWLLVIMLAVLGVVLLVLGFVLMRRARPTAEIKGGFGGPAGSSDVGGQPGFRAPGPHEHWKVGAPLRIVGFACLATSAVIALVQTIAGL